MQDLLSRRHALTGIGAAAGTLLLSRASRSTPFNEIIETARGRVVEASGVPRSSRPGIAGVMVSNGREVTLTDADGHWSLSVRHGDHVFVVVPSDWETLERDCGAFSYLHQPGGTPRSCAVKGPALSPTGELPQSIEFALRKATQCKSFDVLLFADTQSADAKELGYARHVMLEATRATPAAFAIHHGDVMGDDLTLLPDYLHILKDTGIAWHHCPGNHDINLDTIDAKFAFEGWKRYLGPTNYAFQHGGATFILLNNVEFFGHGRVGPDGRGYRGLIGDEQLSFVGNVLRHVPKDDLVVVSMHVPLASFDNPNGEADTTADAAALLGLLSGRPHTVSFSGHSHTTEHHYFGAADGFAGDASHHHQVLTAACGSWWSGPSDANGIPVADSRDGTPKGFHVLSVDRKSYKTRFVPFGAHKNSEMRVTMQSVDGRTTLFADVFDGGPTTRVTCELEGTAGSGVTLKRTSVADPYIVEAFAGYRGNCKPWVAPAKSSHVWTIELPEALARSGVELMVRAVDDRFPDIIERSTVS